MGDGGGGGGRKTARAAKRGGGGGDGQLPEQKLAQGAQVVQNTGGEAPKLPAGDLGGAANPKLKGVKEFEAANPNLKVGYEGEVYVGSKGAPKVNPGKFASDDEAYMHLRRVGLNAQQLEMIEGFESLREVASLVPEGSTYLGAGAEALGVRIPSGEVLRIQWKGGQGVPAYYAGDAAIYGKWKIQAGKIPVELKEYVEGASGKVNKGILNPEEIAAAQSRIYLRAIKYNPDLTDADLYPRNWGFTASGVEKVYDPGGLVPLGGRVLEEGKELNKARLQALKLGRQLNAERHRLGRVPQPAAEPPKFSVFVR